MRQAVIVFVLLLSTACASMQSDSGLGNAKVAIIRPEILISQISSMPAAARYVQGNIPIQYRLRVGNRSGEPITMKSVTVTSMGYGAYRVEPTSRPMKTIIQPDAFESVEFWVPAVVDDASIIGANGPVTLRVALQFDSPVGQFQQVVTQQVNALPGRDSSQ